MSYFKKISSLLLVMMLFTGVSFAQVQQQEQIDSEDVSEQEMEKFAEAASEVQEIRREAQAEFQQIITEEGLEVQRFRMIMMSKQNPQMADSVQVTGEEQEAVENIQPEMEKINQEMAQEFQKSIQDNGLNQQRFQQIAQAMQSSPELQQRFQELQAEEMRSEEDDY